MAEKNTYQLLDSGRGEKLEQFGSIRIIRPAPSALWERKFPELWKGCHAHYIRKGKAGSWKYFQKIPKKWDISLEGIRFWIHLTDFGHLGIFPEQKEQWAWMSKKIQGASFTPRILNLFAYSGGSSLAAALQGAEVTHVDAAKGMVDWANQNAFLNGQKTIRWIIDDALKFVKREHKRGNTYDGIILDPPSFGRGKSGEVFKIEEHLFPLLDLLTEMLTQRALFFLLSCHTPGFTPILLRQLLEERLSGTITQGEMVIEGPFLLPSGVFARWEG